jgi:hypothetical protein
MTLKAEGRRVIPIDVGLKFKVVVDGFDISG